MADVKKTNTAKNGNVNKNNHKPNQNKKFDKKPYEPKHEHFTTTEEAVKVKEVKIVSKDETEEEEDKKLIMIIAIAVLVIIATIIGLLVGCQKQETDEPEQKQDDVIVEPKEDTKDDVAKKTTKKTTKKATKVSTNEVEEEKDLFNIIYYYDEKRLIEDVTEGTEKEPEQLLHHEKVEEGSTVAEYLPKGFNTCKYYTDKEMTTEFDFTTKVKENVNLYLACEAITYKVNYVFNTEVASNTRFDELLSQDVSINPETFNGDETINLNNLITQNVFLGWYLEYDEETDTYSNKVESLSRKLYSFADETNTITLYGKVRESITVKYYTKDETQSREILITDNDSHVVEGNIFELEGFLGWSLDKESNKLVSTSANITDDMVLYAVCGDAVITYDYNMQVVAVGYTDEELLNENFNLPTPSDLGIEPTTYVVPVSEETETSKRIVSDDDVEINLEKQMALSEAVRKAQEGYEPQLGDNVEEKEMEFTGWKESTGEYNPETDKPIVEEEFTTTEDVVKDLTEDQTDPASECLVGESSLPATETPVVEG